MIDINKVYCFKFHYEDKKLAIINLERNLATNAIRNKIIHHYTNFSNLEKNNRFCCAWLQKTVPQGHSDAQRILKDMKIGKE